MNWGFLYLLLINLVTFAVMKIDKRRAKKGLWRIPEKNLFLLAILGGSLGGIAGMRLFHHKTKHKAFTIGFPCVLLLQCVLVLWLWKHVVQEPF